MTIRQLVRALLRKALELRATDYVAIRQEVSATRTLWTLQRKDRTK